MIIMTQVKNQPHITIYEQYNTIATFLKSTTDYGYPKNVEIKIDADSNYISREDARNSWVTAKHPAPGQFPHPMSTVSEKQLSEAQSDFEREIEMLNTEKGIWNDMTTYYAFGEK